MNFWQFKVKMNDWIKEDEDEFYNLEVGNSFFQNVKPVRNKIDDSKGDIVLYYNSHIVKSKNFYEGIYLVCKVVSGVDENNWIELEVIKDLRDTPYMYDVDFSDLHIWHNTVEKRGRAQTFEYINDSLCGLEKFYQRVLNYETVGDKILEDIESIETNKNIDKTEKENLVKCRLGQGTFRRDLIEHWDGCSVTGYSKIDILIASHIKPWKDADKKERLDSFNGLLLLPTLDKLFDKGYISFDENGKIIISSSLENYEALGVSDTMKIDISSKHKKYLKFHRKEVFQS